VGGARSATLILEFDTDEAQSRMRRKAQRECYRSGEVFRQSGRQSDRRRAGGNVPRRGGEKKTRTNVVDVRGEARMRPRYVQPLQSDKRPSRDPRLVSRPA
jgi:hypothetical protein